ncbi:hypothetical protein GQ42DRAFT_88546 [Ramicandelaber brevisporus]|nr:hypothetical protein GQ42DRAFT_88546 [Ramicandelaber brevisporus]
MTAELPTSEGEDRVACSTADRFKGHSILIKHTLPLSSQSEDICWTEASKRAGAVCVDASQRLHQHRCELHNNDKYNVKLSNSFLSPMRIAAFLFVASQSMPLKRKRHTSVTSEDELRTCAQRYLDTADSEQLRAVIDLVQRLGAASSGPFRLFDLPYELLQYTAETFFFRWEAVKLLTVNQAVHQLFADSLWRHISLAGTKLFGRGAQASGVTRYGSRVRSLQLPSIAPRFNIASSFLHVNTLSFKLEAEMESLFEWHMYLLSNLRYVELEITLLSSKMINLALGWLNDGQQSGHVSIINMLVNRSNKHCGAINQSLASLVSNVVNLNRLRFDLTSTVPVPEEIIPTLSSRLVRLKLCKLHPTNCVANINHQFLGSNHSAIFPLLRELHIQLCCSSPNQNDFSSVTPCQLPALQLLVLILPTWTCKAQNAPPLGTIFSWQWPTITGLGIIGNGTNVLNHNGFFAAMPNMNTCSVIDVKNFDINVLTTMRIQELIWNQSSCVGKYKFSQLKYLVKLTLANVTLQDELIRDITACSRLTNVAFHNCVVNYAMAQTFYRYKCLSVRILGIQEGNNTKSCKFERIVQCFPNIRTLELTAMSDARKLVFIQQHPGLKILPSK